MTKNSAFSNISHIRVVENRISPEPRAQSAQHGEVPGFRHPDQRSSLDPGNRGGVGSGKSPSAQDESSNCKPGPSGQPAKNLEEKSWKAKRSASPCVVEC